MGAAHPESITAALERRFLDTRKPRDLTLVYGAGQGDGQLRGLNHLAHEGMLLRVIGGHWGLVPKMGRLAIDEKIDAYNFPQGVVCQLLRDIAARRPGCITHIGLDTFVDPCQAGGRLNARTPAGLVERIELGNQTYLWYKAFPIHVGLIRATAADPRGNLVMDREAVLGEVLPIAQAAHNCGGIVIAQVSELLSEFVKPMHVAVPGILVDHLVVAMPEQHAQTFAEQFNPAFVEAGDVDVDTLQPLYPGTRRIIAERACAELKPGSIVNLGIGIPELIAPAAVQRGILDQLTLTVESGPIGGLPAGGLSFGAAVHPHAIIDQPAQFDFYDGGGLDFAALGAAQIDRHGNVNVSMFGSRVAGVGGFINISQTAKKIVFCAEFTAGNAEFELDSGQLRIQRDGATTKFVRAVDQISFNASAALRRGQEILYVTERAVFRRAASGLELIEVAPGIDVHEHILKRMEFAPVVVNPRTMSGVLFRN